MAFFREIHTLSYIVPARYCRAMTRRESLLAARGQWVGWYGTIGVVWRGGVKVYSDYYFAA